MNKEALIKSVSTKVEGLTQKDAKVMVDTVIESIVEGVIAEGKVALTGFGSFEKVERPQRNGVNPSTGEALVIEAHNAIKFKPSKVLKEAIK